MGWLHVSIYHHYMKYMHIIYKYIMWILTYTHDVLYVHAHYIARFSKVLPQVECTQHRQVLEGGRYVVQLVIAHEHTLQLAAHLRGNTDGRGGA
jgi:hypothetical protein